MAQGKPFYPTRQDEFLQWALSYDSVVQQNPAVIGLDATQAAELTDKTSAFQTAMAVIASGATRTPQAVIDKDEKRAELTAVVRKLTDIIQAFPGTTDQMRSALGITIRDNRPTPTPVPGESPVVTVASVRGRLFNLRLRQPGSERRGRPAFVKTAWLYYYVGEDMPQFEQMTFYGSAPKTNTQLVLPQGVAVGAKVWISACWVNPAEKPGAASLPIFSWTNHGVTAQAA